MWLANKFLVRENENMFLHFVSVLQNESIFLHHGCNRIDLYSQALSLWRFVSFLGNETFFTIE